MTKPLTAKDVPKEWQKAVEDRAKSLNKSEDWVIKHGLHAEVESSKDVRKEMRDLQKESEKTLKLILKELKK